MVLSVLFVLFPFASLADITRADLRKTIEHIRELSGKQALELAAAKKENDLLKAELQTAGDTVHGMTQQLQLLEANLDSLRQWGRDQEQIATKELKARITAESELAVIQSRYHRMKWMVSTALAALGALAVWRIVGVWIGSIALYCAGGAAIAIFTCTWIYF